MPSLTSLSLYTLTNLGPLTTTWTAPATCITPAAVYLAPTDIPDQAYISSECAALHDGACYPGVITHINEIYTTEENGLVGGVIPYYSPGLYCPYRYATAGIAVKDGDGKLVNSSGLFARTTYGEVTIGSGVETYTSTMTGYVRVTTTTESLVDSYTSTWVSIVAVPTTIAPSFNPNWNVFMEALGPSETAVVCCPSGYSVNFYGSCYSNVPVTEYTDSTHCQRFTKGHGTYDDFTTASMTFTYNGVTVTGEQVIQTGNLVMPSTRQPYLPTNLEEYTGIAYAPMVTLVHTASDNAASTAETGALGTLSTFWAIMAFATTTLMALV